MPRTDIPFSRYRLEVMADRPLGYWRLGEAAGAIAKDESARHLDGTYVNAPTLGAAGCIDADPDTATTFAAASSQRVDLPSAAIPGGTMLALEAWIKSQSGLNVGVIGRNGVSSLVAAGNEITDAMRNGGLQGDGLVAPAGYGLWQAATNLCTNGGFETNTTGWTGNNGGTITQDTTHVKFGTKALKLVCTASGNARAEYTTGISLTSGQTYTFTAWAYLDATSADNLLLRVVSQAGSGSGDFAAAAFSTKGVWTRVTLTFTATTTTVHNLRLQNAAGLAMLVWIDGVQVENAAIPTPYIETSAGTAARGAGRVQAQSSVINATQGWAAFRIKYGWPTTAMPGGTSGKDYLLDWRDDANNLLGLYFDEATKKWTVARLAASSGASAVSATQTIAIGDSATVIIAVTATQVKVSVNGGAFVAASNTNIPALAATMVDLGSQAGASQFDGNIVWASFGTGTLTDGNASTINGFGDNASMFSDYPSGATITAIWRAVTTTANFNPANLSVVFGAMLGCLNATQAQLLLGTSGGTQIANITGTLPNDGLRHHVVGTYDGATAILYVDGVQVASAAAVGAVDSTVGTGTAIGYNDYFTGTIDEAATYSYALTAAAVARHYRAGLADYQGRDGYFLTDPDGTVVDLARFADHTQGVDFGDAGILQTDYIDNPYTDGAHGINSTQIRKMAFPLSLASHAAFAGLDGLKVRMKRAAVAGAFIDLHFFGASPADGLRFDVLGGRHESDGYSPFVRKGSRAHRDHLALETQPLGYIPSWTTLASVASIALPGTLTGFGGSPIGDYPGLAEILVAPTSASWRTDGIAWGNAGAPSFNAILSAASWSGMGASQAKANALDGIGAAFSSTNAWSIAGYYTVASGLDPAYRGRYRAFAAIQPVASGVQFLADTTPAVDIRLSAMASAQPIATSSPTALSGFELLDLGELTLPAAASGVQQPQYVRLWSKGPGTASPFFGGLFMLPLQGQAGVLPRGLMTPTIGASSSLPGSFLVAADGRGVLAYSASQAAGDLGRYYRGNFPLLGASVNQINLLGFQRQQGAASSSTQARVDAGMWAQASVRYLPRFAFAKAI